MKFWSILILQCGDDLIICLLNIFHFRYYFRKHDPNRTKHVCEICAHEFCTQDAVKKHVLRMHSGLEPKFKFVMFSVYAVTAR